MLTAARTRALAAGALVVWAGALIYDMSRLKQRPEFKSSDLGGGSVRVFGVRVDGGPEETRQE